MVNTYYETLSEVREYLEKKYNITIDSIPAISYETMERVRTDKCLANIYRMPSGRYEVVDYELTGKR